MADVEHYVEPRPFTKVTRSALLQALAIRVLVLVAASFVIFCGTALIPGDFVSQYLGQDYSEELATRLRAELGLDQPFLVRFFFWLGAFASGDLGMSFTTRTDVWSVVQTPMWNTFFLAIMTLAIWFPVSLLLSIAAFLGSRTARKVYKGITQLILCTPEFFIAYLGIYLISIKLGVLPSVAKLTGNETLIEHARILLLPCFVLGIGLVAYVGRLFFALLLIEEKKDYFEYAQLKGLSRMSITFRYIVPSLWPSILSLLCIYCAYLLTGVMVVEVIFGYDGLGYLTVSSVVWRDVPVIQFCSMFITTLYLAFYSVSDLVTDAASERTSL